jgi:predicted aspartyl protease
MITMQGIVTDVGALVRVSILSELGASLDGLALIDTGSNRTILDVAVADKLGLPTVGQWSPVTPCGACVMPIYRATVRVGDAMDGGGGNTYAGMHLGPHAGIIAALGQDFLKDVRFSFDGPRRMWRIEKS